jgi:serpin B
MERLNSRELDEVLMAASDEDVVLILPRFEVEGSLNLFAQLELTDVLPANPDFSEMTDADVTISEFRQKIQLTVDEDGTRAAAVTSTSIDTSSIRDTEPKLVEADRPFLLLVMHLPSRTTLFAAQINQPKAPTKDTLGK